MKNRLQNLLQDRKTLYFVLSIVMVLVFTLSIAYAAMSTVLEIHGNSEVVASTWDIHLENVQVKSGSVSANAPEISGNSTLVFDVELNVPGDYYEFTVDVVNDGSIDAMINDVIKTPELTAKQAKLIKYEVSYEYGESISNKQILKKNTSTSVKVRVEYRKDITDYDLPSESMDFNLKLTLVYVQSDETYSNGSSTNSVVRVLSGDGTHVGNEICIKDECFYVISSDSDSVTMLAKHNLYVGNIYDVDYGEMTPIENPTGKQDATASGYNLNDIIFVGVTLFSNDSQKGTYYSDYSGSIVEGYVNSYNSYLITQGVIPIEARLITKDELMVLGCSDIDWTCNAAPSWIRTSSYWSSSSDSSETIWSVLNDEGFDFYAYSYSEKISGVRPVITISRYYL